MSKKVVAVGMSGGVDSSVTAYLLQKQGYEVIGITMKHWGGIEESKSGKSCCTIDDVYDAKRVCDQLGIPHYTVNFMDEFKKDVVDYFIEEYENGRTPNPCVVCNRKIKLGKLYEFVKTIGAEYLATGHYAVIKDGELYARFDNPKDQAYFLSQVDKETFKHLMFPLGDMKKEEVREIAKEAGIKVHAKKDSQEICFIDNDDYKDFLIKMTDGKILKKGNIVDETGKVLGKHECTSFYTIGQRKGLGISSPHPLYVLGSDTAKRTVIVGKDEQLMRKSLICNNINLLSVDKIEELQGKEAVVRGRSRDKYHRAVLEVIEEDKIKINFIDEVRAVTPGQVAVFYESDGKVIGSGFIVE